MKKTLQLILTGFKLNRFFFLCFVEVASSHVKKTAAGRTYVSALCRILVMLHFRLTEQGAIKLMRCLLNLVAESVLAEKDLLKELKRMAEHLKAVDRQPEQKLLPDQANTILGKNLSFLGEEPGRTVLF